MPAEWFLHSPLYIAASSLKLRTLQFLKAHHSIPEASIGITPPHGAESLQKGEAITALGDGEGPERGRRD